MVCTILCFIAIRNGKPDSNIIVVMLLSMFIGFIGMFVVNLILDLLLIGIESIKESKNKVKAIIETLLIILLIGGYFLAFYPAKVSTNEYGEPRCESIIGLKVGC